LTILKQSWLKLIKDLGSNFKTSCMADSWEQVDLTSQIAI
jgi:hypothetical protein